MKRKPISPLPLSPSCCRHQGWAYVTKDKARWRIERGRVGCRAQAAKDRNVDGWVISLQNTTQQPSLLSLSNRSTRQALFQCPGIVRARGLKRHARRHRRLAQLRALKAKLLGYPNYAAWNLRIRWRTRRSGAQIHGCAVPAATARAVVKPRRSGAYRCAAGWVCPGTMGLELLFRAGKKGKYDLDEAQTRPYFELNNVSTTACSMRPLLYGISFKQRNDIPV